MVEVTGEGASPVQGSWDTASRHFLPDTVRTRHSKVEARPLQHCEATSLR
jgi:hypothetical protein